ncbi:MAG: molybdopterin-dependent oxidoreductase [Coriobacteriaceae bacterium]|jgi:anaerobic dimethyl sulfoxide reductase subunit A|nr:molybdopterin-dependent oxidoreductase [Coriobacteriaceae bacterium]
MDKKRPFSRRGFIAAAAASAALATMVGCSPSNEPNGAEAGEKPEKKEYRRDPELDPAVEGKWVTAACWHNCGGRCLNKAYVSEGVVIRQKTDDTHQDSTEFPQQRACLRGRSQQQQVYASERIKYPMKRKNWEPEGKGKRDLRGIDEWERISWEEAIGLVAQELERVYRDWGPRAVFTNSYGSGETSNILKLLGGHVTMAGTDSYGTWKAGPLMLGTSFENYNPDLGLANDRLDLPNADTIVLYGANPAWASAGLPMVNLMGAARNGTRFVYVGPSLNVSAQALDAKWIPVRPGTDTAFLLAVAYVMISEDDPEGSPLIDWDFLNRCTVGFDSEHMPADAQVDENFKDYVLGVYDACPKTPEWASEICGTPSEDIIWYAKAMGCKNNVIILHSYAPARCYGAEDFPQLFMTIGAMGGHMGKPGNATAGAYQYDAANSGPRLVRWGTDSYFNPASYANKITEVIPASFINKSIIEGRYFFFGSWAGGTMSVRPGEWRDLDIKLIFSQAANFFQTRIDVNKAVEAYRKVETIVNVSYDFNPSAQYSDIVLPACTAWETKWPLLIGLTATWVNRDTLILPSPVIEPLFESKSDYEIGLLLADALGLKREDLYTKSPEQAQLGYIAGAQVLGDDGTTWEPLVTITEEDLAFYRERFGEASCDQQKGRISLQEFVEKGVYQVERKKGDNRGSIGYEAFRKDPEANPRPSASGKLEIFCQQKADAYNTIGYKNETYKPYPTYHVPVDGYEASFTDWAKKQKGPYPFQMFTPHYLRRSHTTMDNPPWLREAMANPAWINAADAKKKGISEGDTVLVYNQYGKVLRKASILESVMPGCIALPHGPWPRIDPKTGIDLNGNENLLTGTVEQPQPQLQGFNTVLVDYEKWTGEALPDDFLVAACDMPELGKE